MKSETPRTDAESKRVRTNCDELTEPVSAELARQLERELNQARAALKAAETFMQIWKPTPYSDGCECGSCQVTRALKYKNVAAMPNVRLSESPTKTP